MEKIIKRVIISFLLLFLTSLLFLSCDNTNNPPSYKTQEIAPQIPKTIIVEDTTKIKELRDSIVVLNGAVDSVSKVIHEEDVVNAYKLERIKYYVTITEKNKNNKQFFYGWVKRVME
jgi:hypothetical protein